MKTENILTIIIIIIILLIILSIIAPRFFKEVERSYYNPLHGKTNIINAGIDVYKLHTDMLPKTLEDLKTCPAGLENLWKGPYLKESQLLDPWGNLFIYEPNTAAPHGYVLISYGKDGKPGGEGYNADIINN